jgi:hypothetical protein
VRVPHDIMSALGDRDCGLADGTCAAAGAGDGSGMASAATPAQLLAQQIQDLSALWLGPNSTLATTNFISLYGRVVRLISARRSREAHASRQAGAASADGPGRAVLCAAETERQRAAHFWELDAEVLAATRALYSDADLLGLLTGGASTRLPPEPSYLFTSDRGVLALSPAKKDALRVRMVQVDLAADDECMGSLPSRWLLEHVVGYDTAVLNAILHAVGGRGLVLAEHTGETYALSHASEVERFAAGFESHTMFRVGTICSAIFLLFATSSLVSFILGQTQHRMLRFTAALQHHVRARLPLLPLVASHLLESLVFVPIMLGVLFFLFEFFSDQLLAFLVLLSVWACEFWSIVACRTEASLKIFPRVFGLHHAWFYVYYLTYPFGYQYLCLATSSCGVAAWLFHLWNRFELPALLDGRISAARPRAPVVAGIMNFNALAPELLGLEHMADGPDAGAANVAAEDGGGHVASTPLAAAAAAVAASGGPGRSPLVDRGSPLRPSSWRDGMDGAGRAINSTSAAAAAAWPTSPVATPPAGGAAARPSAPAGSAYRPVSLSAGSVSHLASPSEAQVGAGAGCTAGERSTATAAVGYQGQPSPLRAPAARDAATDSDVTPGTGDAGTRGGAGGGTSSPRTRRHGNAFRSLAF